MNAMLRPAFFLMVSVLTHNFQTGKNWHWMQGWNQLLWQYDNWLYLKFVLKIKLALKYIICYFLHQHQLYVIWQNVKYALAHSFCQILIKIWRWQNICNFCTICLALHLKNWNVIDSKADGLLLLLTETDLRWFDNYTGDMFIITIWKLLIAMLH